jgi:hypothetical protein
MAKALQRETAVRVARISADSTRRRVARYSTSNQSPRCSNISFGLVQKSVRSVAGLRNLAAQYTNVKEIGLTEAVVGDGGLIDSPIRPTKPYEGFDHLQSRHAHTYFKVAQSKAATKTFEHSGGGFFHPISTQGWCPMQAYETIIDLSSKVVATIGGLIAAFTAISELRRGREEKARKLIWDQTKEAQRMVEEVFYNDESFAALTMLDWDRPHKLPDGSELQISREKMRRALRTQHSSNETGFDKAEIYVRDCFDSLFGHVEMIEHAISVQLIEFTSVKTSFEYYVGLMKEPLNSSVFDNYLTNYGYMLTLKFLRRFDNSCAN